MGGKKKEGKKEGGGGGGGGGHKHDFVFSQNADVAEVQQESLATLDSISVECFRQCFKQWVQRWDRCIQSQGECF